MSGKLNADRCDVGKGDYPKSVQKGTSPMSVCGKVSVFVSQCLSCPQMRERKRKKRKPRTSRRNFSQCIPHRLSLSPSFCLSPSAPPLSRIDALVQTEEPIFIPHPRYGGATHANPTAVFGDVSPHCAACNKSVHHFCAMI